MLLSTPSLGITTRPALGLMKPPRIEPFNSLSRDHEFTRFTGPYLERKFNFQLPLSGSQAPRRCGGIRAAIRLSTPSLGITAHIIVTWLDAAEILSTPSLGITQEIASWTNGYTGDLSTPSLGITGSRNFRKSTNSEIRTFNSLSRDHPRAQNSEILTNRPKLSTPSLGIT